MKVLCVDDIKHVKTNEVADKHSVAPYKNTGEREGRENQEGAGATVKWKWLFPRCYYPVGL